jgi:hypothetical protein
MQSSADGHLAATRLTRCRTVESCHRGFENAIPTGLRSADPIVERFRFLDTINNVR